MGPAAIVLPIYATVVAGVIVTQDDDHIIFVLVIKIWIYFRNKLNLKFKLAFKIKYNLTIINVSIFYYLLNTPNKMNYY